MSFLDLTQVATIWGTSAIDGNGDPTYSVGVKIAARWTDQDGIITDDNGDDHKTQYVVYADQVIPKRTMVALGDFSGQASPINGSRKVMFSISNPSMTDLVKHLI